MEIDPEPFLGLPVCSRHRDTSLTLPDQVHQRDQRRLGWWMLSAQRAPTHSTSLPDRHGATEEHRCTGLGSLGWWPVLHPLCCSVTGILLCDLTWQSSSQISLEEVLQAALLLHVGAQPPRRKTFLTLSCSPETFLHVFTHD